MARLNLPRWDEGDEKRLRDKQVILSDFFYRIVSWQKVLFSMVQQVEEEL